jgi:hypothetical protein
MFCFVQNINTNKASIQNKAIHQYKQSLYTKQSKTSIQKQSKTLIQNKANHLYKTKQNIYTKQNKTSIQSKAFIQTKQNIYANKTCIQNKAKHLYKTKQNIYTNKNETFMNCIVLYRCFVCIDVLLCFV